MLVNNFAIAYPKCLKPLLCKMRVVIAVLVVMAVKSPFHAHRLGKARNRLETVRVANRRLMRYEDVGLLAVEVKPVIVENRTGVLAQQTIPANLLNRWMLDALPVRPLGVLTGAQRRPVSDHWHIVAIRVPHCSPENPTEPGDLQAGDFCDFAVQVALLIQLVAPEIHVDF